MGKSRLEQAIITLNRHQSAALSDSHISDIDPRALLIVTILYLVTMLSVPVQSLSMLIWFAVYPIVTAPLSHIAYERVFLKSLYIVPIVVVFGIFNPLYDKATAFTVGSVDISYGWLSLVSLIVRGVLSLQALLLLIYVVGFNSICGALRQLRVPGVLVTQLLLVYRYTIVMLQESLEMQRASASRGYGKKAYPIRLWGQMVGQLLIRTVNRGFEIHRSMIARGFNGSLPVASPHKWNAADTLYCLIWIGLFILLRVVDFSTVVVNATHLQ